MVTVSGSTDFQVKTAITLRVTRRVENAWVMNGVCCSRDFVNECSFLFLGLDVFLNSFLQQKETLYGCTNGGGGGGGGGEDLPSQRISCDLLRS